MDWLDETPAPSSRRAPSIKARYGSAVSSTSSASTTVSTGISSGKENRGGYGLKKDHAVTFAATSSFPSVLSSRAPLAELTKAYAGRPHLSLDDSDEEEGKQGAERAVKPKATKGGKAPAAPVAPPAPVQAKKHNDDDDDEDNLLTRREIRHVDEKAIASVVAAAYATPGPAFGSSNAGKPPSAGATAQRQRKRKQPLLKARIITAAAAMIPKATPVVAPAAPSKKAEKKKEEAAPVKAVDKAGKTKKVEAASTEPDAKLAVAGAAKSRAAAEPKAELEPEAEAEADSVVEIVDSDKDDKDDKDDEDLKESKGIGSSGGCSFPMMDELMSAAVVETTTKQARATMKELYRRTTMLNNNNTRVSLSLSLLPAVPAVSSSIPPSTTEVASTTVSGPVSVSERVAALNSRLASASSNLHLMASAGTSFSRPSWMPTNNKRLSMMLPPGLLSAAAQILPSSSSSSLSSDPLPGFGRLSIASTAASSAAPPPFPGLSAVPLPGLAPFERKRPRLGPALRLPAASTSRLESFDEDEDKRRPSALLSPLPAMTEDEGEEDDDDDAPLLGEEDEEEPKQGIAKPSPLPIIAASSAPSSAPAPVPPPPAHAPFPSACLSSILEFLDVKELFALSTVNKSWRDACASSFNWRNASAMQEPDFASAVERVMAELKQQRAANTHTASAKKKAGKGATAVVAAGKKKGAVVAEAAPSLASPSRHLSILGLPIYTSLSSSFFSAFPFGCFLSEGAYKRVWRVWNSHEKQYEAVSVMDVAALAPSGSLPVVATEIQVATMASEILRAGTVCPNFVEVKQVFLSSKAPFKDFPQVWGKGSDAQEEGEEGEEGGESDEKIRAPHGRQCPFDPSSTLSDAERDAAVSSIAASHLEATRSGSAGNDHESNGKEGLFQFIRMELCEGGDLEGHLRDLEPLLLEAEASASTPEQRLALDNAGARFFQSCFFQTVYAFYCARERLGLRHWDSKALNLFLSLPPADGGSKGRTPGSNSSPAAASLCQYHVGALTFNVALGSEPSRSSASSSSSSFAALQPRHLVKLADFGTADVKQEESFGQPIKPYHFTTLENTAPELLICGSAATQSFATADTFALGLVAVHLLTGSAPYEEILADLQCPAALVKELERLWWSEEPFSALRVILSEDVEHVLATTLYRYLVLLAAAPATPSPSGDQAAENHDDAKKRKKKAPVAASASPAVDGPSSFAVDLSGLAAGPVSSLLSAVVSGANTPASKSGKVSAAQITALQRTFQQDCSVFNLWRGSHPLLSRAQRRIAQLPAAAAAAVVLRRLLAFNPEERPTMLSLLSGDNAKALFGDLLAPLPTVAEGCSIKSFWAYQSQDAAELQDV